MGYLLKNDGYIVKFTTLIPELNMKTLFSAPFELTPTQKTGYNFCLVSAFIQVKGPVIYNNWTYIWINQQGGTNKGASMQKTNGNTLVPNASNVFTMGVDVNTQIKYGTFVNPSSNYFLSMNIDDNSGDGDAVVTLYGVYLPNL